MRGVRRQTPQPQYQIAVANIRDARIRARPGRRFNLIRPRNYLHRFGRRPTEQRPFERHLPNSRQYVRALRFTYRGFHSPVFETTRTPIWNCVLASPCSRARTVRAKATCSKPPTCWRLPRRHVRPTNATWSTGPWLRRAGTCRCSGSGGTAIRLSRPRSTST